MRYLKTFVMLVVLAALGGCMSMPIPISETRVNPDLFAGNPDVLADKIKLLKPEMTKIEVFSILGITEKTPNLRLMSEPDIRSVLYGNTQPSTFEDGQQFHAHVSALEGLELPFIAKKRSGWFALPFH